MTRISKKSKKKRVPKKKKFFFPSQSFVVKHRQFLHRIYNAAQSGQRDHLRQLISSASKGELKALCESAHNLLRGNYPSSSQRFLERLAPFKKILRKLSCKKNTLKKIKGLILKPSTTTTTTTSNQQGGVFPIGALLAPIIGGLIGSAI